MFAVDCILWQYSQDELRFSLKELFLFPISPAADRAWSNISSSSSLPSCFFFFFLAFFFFFSFFTFFGLGVFFFFFLDFFNQGSATKSQNLHPFQYYITHKLSFLAVEFFSENMLSLSELDINIWECTHGLTTLT